MNEITQIPLHEILCTTREHRNLSVESVATELHLSVSVIKAIEEGRYDSLYGEAFVCGALRSYAKLLGLDAGDIVSAYKQSRPQPEKPVEEPEMRFTTTPVLLQHKQYGTGYGVAAVLALVVMLGVFSQKETDVVSAKADSGIAIETAIGTTIVNSMDEMPVENPTQDLLPEVISNPVARESQVAGDGTTDVINGVNNEISSLSFTFSADCWVEVRDGNNQKIFASMQRAQERLELQGKPPFRITLGYAPGVALSYNSQPVTIDAGNSNVAKLVLGNS